VVGVLLAFEGETRFTFSISAAWLALLVTIYYLRGLLPSRAVKPVSPDEELRGASMKTALGSPELFVEQPYPRIAKEVDINPIISLINRAFADDNPFLLKDRVDIDEVRHLMRKGHFLLLEVEGSIISLIYAEIREDGRGYLGLLVVDPATRRGGLGKQMLYAGEDFCRQRGCRLIEGVVIDRRPDLIERYKRFGFRVVREAPGDRPGHVDGGYSLILIEKDLLNQVLRPCP